MVLGYICASEEIAVVGWNNLDLNNDGDKLTTIDEEYRLSLANCDDAILRIELSCIGTSTSYALGARPRVSRKHHALHPAKGRHSTTLVHKPSTTTETFRYLVHFPRKLPFLHLRCTPLEDLSVSI